MTKGLAGQNGRKKVQEAVSSAIAEARREFGLPDAKCVRVLVGFSGGEDSHVLLHALNSVKESLLLEIFVCHVDHGLRPNSAAEAVFASNLAERYRNSFLLFSAGTRPPGENIEAWARQVRYGFFSQAMKENRLDFVMTAHHLDDLAETLLERILNGRLATDALLLARVDPKRRLLRPLLGLEKSCIREYVREMGLAFVTDESNSDLGRTRNRIRHVLIPQLKRDYNPRLLGSLSEITRRLGADEEWLWKEARRLARPHDFDSLTELPEALCWRALRILAEEELGTIARGLGYGSLKRVSELLCRMDRGEKRLDLGRGIRCRLSREEGIRFSLLNEEKQARSDQQRTERKSLNIPGSVVWNSGLDEPCVLETWVIETRDGSALELLANLNRSEAYAPELCYFDLEALNPESLILRSAEPGDAVRVWKRGRRKLKKLFQERHLSLWERKSTVLVESEEGILWVPRIAVRSEHAPLTSESRLVLELRFSGPRRAAY